MTDPLPDPLARTPLEAAMRASGLLLQSARVSPPLLKAAHVVDAFIHDAMTVMDAFEARAVAAEQALAAATRVADVARELADKNLSAFRVEGMWLCCHRTHFHNDTCPLGATWPNEIFDPLPAVGATTGDPE